VTIEKLDLNLFKVFQAVLRHRSVSAASRELNVTSSAVSHALARLRQAIGDELFVSGESGMEPTPRARELAPGVSDGLERITRAISAQPFKASETHRTFRIAATDNFAITMLPRLVERMTSVSPQINLSIFPTTRLDVIRALDEGQIDFVVGWFRDLPERMRRATVAVEHETVVVRAGHPLTTGPVTRERLLAFPHIVVETTGGEAEPVDGYVDDRGAFRRVWIERLLMETEGTDRGLLGRVAISVPYHGAVAPLLLVSDMVATLPRRLANAAAAESRLVLLDLPYEPLAVSLEAVWHQRSDRDQGIRWLISLLQDALKPDDAEFQPPPPATPLAKYGTEIC
jgi:DNA-binding transcriptional LysR family regulator